MGKLTNLKKWLTLPETAQHLTIVFGEEVTSADVLRLGLDDRLQLSIYLASITRAERMLECNTLINSGDKPIYIDGVFDFVMRSDGAQSLVKQLLFASMDSDIIVAVGTFDGIVVEGSDGRFVFVSADGFPIGSLPDNSFIVIRTDELRRFEQSVSEAPAGVEAESPTPADTDADLASLFDPVKHAQLEKMFPDDGKWAEYANRAAGNGLAKAARDGRGQFNPYKAARWWIDTKGPSGWDWERCRRKLANNLPDRSLDSKHLLTGEI